MVAALVIIIPVAFFAYWYLTNRDLFNASAPNQSVADITKNERVKDVEVDKSAVLNAIASLNKCGDWPLTTTTLSANRGNPFEPQKNSGEVAPVDTGDAPIVDQPISPVTNCQPLYPISPAPAAIQSVPVISQ